MANYIDKIKIQDTSYELHDARIKDVDRTPTLDALSNIVTSNGIAVAFGAIESKYAPAKDLSLYDIRGNRMPGRNTANTYVVTGPGRYMFPLVYGNGIKNGSINTAAYNTTPTTKTEVLRGINYPLISMNVLIDKDLHANVTTDKSNYTPQLLWQTDPNFIIAAEVISREDTYYIQFQVNNLPATNAIAHIAVYDALSSCIVWSWMIWGVSNPSDLDEVTVTNKTNVEYMMLKTPVGAIWNEERTRYVTPYYQWGRKDPMYPLSNVDFTNTIALYDITGQSISNTIKTKTSELLDETIKNPDTMYIQAGVSSGKWCTLYNNKLEYCNFWNNTSTIDTSTQYAGLIDNKDTAVKTIYDPSPTGYMVPTSLWATGFCSNTYAVMSYIEDPDPTKIIGGWDHGFTFKLNANDTVGWRICANGSRSGTIASPGNLLDPEKGNYWTSGVCAVNANDLSSWKFNIDYRSVAPHMSEKYITAMGVLPMKES